MRLAFGCVAERKATRLCSRKEALSDVLPPVLAPVWLSVPFWLCLWRKNRCRLLRCLLRHWLRYILRHASRKRFPVSSRLSEAGTPQSCGNHNHNLYTVFIECPLHKFFYGSTSLLSAIIMVIISRIRVYRYTLGIHLYVHGIHLPFSMCHDTQSGLPCQWQGLMSALKRIIDKKSHLREGN